MKPPSLSRFGQLVFSIGTAMLFVTAVLILIHPLTIQAAPAACVAGPHTGSITSQEWCPADNPHILSGNVTVGSGVTLTLQPGVIVQGNSGTRIAVSTGGTLYAVGTPADPITLTSSADSGPAQWAGFYFSGGTGQLEYVTIRYAGQYDGWARASIRLQNANVTIVNSQVLSGSIVGQADYGVHLCCNGSTAVISNTLFSGNGNDLNHYVVSDYQSGDSLTLINSTFINNPGYPIQVNAASLHAVSGNSFSGNGLDRIVSMSGSSNSLSQNTQLTAQTGLEAYQINTTLRVPAGLTLTIGSGVKMMFNTGQHLQVLGTLQAIGTSTQPITFTSVADSAPGEWGGIYLNGGDAVIQHSILRNAGQYNGWGRAGINVAYGSLLLEDSEIRDIQNVGNADFGVHLCCNGAGATIHNTLFANIGDTTDDIGVFSTSASDLITITNSTFQNITGYPVQIHAANVHHVNGNSFSGNGFDRILVNSGDVSDGAHLTAQTGLQAYELNGGLRVPAARTLFIDPGVMLMARSGTDFKVFGHLDAQGTPTQPITLTSVLDSAPEQWGNLYVQEGSADLRYVTLRYGGQFVSGNLVAGVLFLQSGAGLPVTMDHVTLRDNAYSGGTTETAMSINGSHVTMSDSLITNNGNGTTDYTISMSTGAFTATHSAITGNAGLGLYATNGQTSLTCSSISSNGNDGVRLTGSSTLFTSMSSAITDNGGLGLNNSGTHAANALYNWWGDASGPGGVGPGTGDEVSANVLYDPWLPQAECAVDLSLGETAVPNPVIAGTPITYTLVLSNSGPGAANGVLLTDTLSGGAVLLGSVVSQGAGCSEMDGSVTCDLGDVAIDGQAAVTLTVQVDPVARGDWVNTAVLAATQTDLQPLNNSTAFTSTVLAEVDLALDVTPLAAAAVLNQPTTFTATISNGGPSTALGVMLTDTLPAGLTFVAGSAGCGAAAELLTCDVGNVAMGETAVLTLTLLPTLAGPIDHTLQVSTTDPDSNPANDAVQVSLTVANIASFTAAAQTLWETAGMVTVTVELVAPAVGETAVPYTVSGTATSGEDYILSDGVITVADGATTASLSFALLPDQLLEPDETIVITLGGTTAVVPGTQPSYTITLINIYSTFVPVMFNG